MSAALNTGVRLHYFHDLSEHPLRSKEMQEFNKFELDYAHCLIASNSNLGDLEWLQFLKNHIITDPKVRENRRIKLSECLAEAAAAAMPKVKHRRTNVGAE